MCVLYITLQKKDLEIFVYGKLQIVRTVVENKKRFISARSAHTLLYGTPS